MMSEFEQVSVADFIVSNYKEYGVYSALRRAVPGIDGLKPVHRRILMALNESASGKFIGTLAGIGAIQTIHPFGNESLENTLADMVRIGAIDGQGEFGVKLLEDVPAAAPRYTKVGLASNKAKYYFQLAKHVEMVEGEEVMEYSYLPIPVPYSLVYGAFNWTIGISSRHPAFTYESLVDAYRNDDPYLLKAQYGYGIDLSDSELTSLWLTGKGKLTYQLTVNRVHHDCIDIFGSGELIKPKLGELEDLAKEGKIIIQNLSSDKVYVRVIKAPRIRSVDMDEVYRVCCRIANKTRNYHIQIVHNNKIHTVGIRDWLSITMSLYNDAFTIHKTKTVDSINNQIEIFTALPQVGKLVMEDKSDKEIMKVMSISQDVLTACLSKSINMLRKGDHSDKISQLESQRRNVESQKPEDLINEMKSVF